MTTSVDQTNRWCVDTFPGSEVYSHAADVVEGTDEDGFNASIHQTFHSTNQDSTSLCPPPPPVCLFLLSSLGLGAPEVSGGSKLDRLQRAPPFPSPPCPSPPCLHAVGHDKRERRGIDGAVALLQWTNTIDETSGTRAKLLVRTPKRRAICLHWSSCSAFFLYSSHSTAALAILCPRGASWCSIMLWALCRRFSANATAIGNRSYLNHDRCHRSRRLLSAPAQSATANRYSVTKQCETTM